MDIVLTETQYQKIYEITIANGKMKDDVYPKFMEFMNYKFSEKKILKKTKEYFEGVVGIEKFKKNFGSDYINDLEIGISPNQETLNGRDLKKVFKKIDVISNLCFYLARSFLKMKKGVELLYTKVHYQTSECYFFFDPELEELVGRMTIDESNGNNAQVSLSAVDEFSKGKGIGKNMYLTILNIYDTIYSDTILYPDSLNVWVNVLPNYAKSFGYINSSRRKKKFSPGTKINFDDVYRFYASNK